MNVLVVAPYPPQRDGIAAYAAAQVEALRSEGHRVTVLSPPDADGDVRAPFVGGRALLRAASMGARFDRIVVHFQPLLYFRPHAPLSKLATSYAFKWLALRRGRRLELVVHEADPPKLRRPDYRGLRFAFGRAAAVSFHTRTEWEALERGYRVRVRGRVVPHLAAPVVAESRDEARRKLGIAEPGSMFVCPGFVQPSKGFDSALEAFAQAFGDIDAGAMPGVRLYVVGSVRTPDAGAQAYADRLAEACANTPGATFVSGFASDEEFDRWICAADWVVLPYRRSFSSGVLARAHALGRPAIVSAVGGLAEQAAGRDVVVSGDDGLARAMRRAAHGE